MKNSNIRYLALGGIIGPVIFILAIITNASLRSDYSHISNFISDLGNTGSPNAAVMNYGGFLPFGLMMIAFGLSLLIMLPKGPGFRIGPFLVLVFGIGVLLAGLYSGSDSCPPECTRENMIHDYVSLIAFFSAIIGIGILSFSFRNHQDWAALSVYSMITCLVAILFLALMIRSVDARIYTGMWQRLFLLTLFVWFSIVGWRACRLGNR